uniref:C3H1-type domain-containing protein n=1 Tax=Chromera velia CCMP2878 TaxID=1169474 RepID=A0A0G4HP64_9ALVE|eukprot:Cvel_7715.t1-p1 / transcript=Cvel_7715.t1 / gene=Cvel_7715 / organism=Chromera_velia_CCMP2878 / gene_product=Zinc finger CCCH domain-containing protein 3, putative / transcript_product=Zinc finger CCCH domain-containing protein 3, putative / location=Cvel_scaffold410:17329-19200(-) / protein_length=518 / sequence_SO=supercontig / SO=protein_coding / is_pseudo=false
MQKRGFYGNSLIASGYRPTQQGRPNPAARLPPRSNVWVNPALKQQQQQQKPTQPTNPPARPVPLPPVSLNAAPNPVRPASHPPPSSSSSSSVPSQQKPSQAPATSSVQVAPSTTTTTNPAPQAPPKFVRLGGNKLVLQGHQPKPKPKPTTHQPRHHHHHPNSSQKQPQPGVIKPPTKTHHPHHNRKALHSHTHGGKRKMTLSFCKFFSRFGRCKRGDACPHAHDKSQVTLCSFWQKGKCRNKECLYRHQMDLPRDERPPCADYQLARCFDVHCPYRHVLTSTDPTLLLPVSPLDALDLFDFPEEAGPGGGAEGGDESLVSSSSSSESESESEGGSDDEDEDERMEGDADGSDEEEGEGRETESESEKEEMELGGEAERNGIDEAEETQKEEGRGSRGQVGGTRVDDVGCSSFSSPSGCAAELNFKNVKANGEMMRDVSSSSSGSAASSSSSLLICSATAATSASSVPLSSSSSSPSAAGGMDRDRDREIEPGEGGDVEMDGGMGRGGEFFQGGGLKGR